MLRVFQIVPEVAPALLTVIAADDGGASRIFSAWLERHHPEEQVGKTHVRAVGANELALQPQLNDAVDRGVEGVAYWCGHRLGYYVAAPQEVQIGALGPTAPTVKCFEVDDEAELVLVFALTNERARKLFQEWNRLAYGDSGENATVSSAGATSGTI